MVHELSRNKESLPHSLRIESLPISTFIRGHFGLKFPLKKIPKQRVHWLLKASRFQSGKNAESLAVPPPSACGHQGAAHEVVGRAAATRVGCCFRACSAVWRILPPPCFRRYTPPSRDCHPSAPLGPSCKAKCSLGNPAADGLGLVPDKGLATPRPN